MALYELEILLFKIFLGPFHLFLYVKCFLKMEKQKCLHINNTTQTYSKMHYWSIVLQQF